VARQDFTERFDECTGQPHGSANGHHFYVLVERPKESMREQPGRNRDEKVVTNWRSVERYGPRCSRHSRLGRHPLLVSRGLNTNAKSEIMDCFQTDSRTLSVATARLWRRWWLWKPLTELSTGPRKHDVIAPGIQMSCARVEPRVAASSTLWTLSTLTQHRNAL
jgi:hypothetical protein